MAPKPRIRALVLAAGFGTRLEPLSHFCAKPLLPVCGEPIVGYSLRRLQETGCEGAVLNLHHLPATIPAYLGKSYFGLRLRYQVEEQIQGTAGALWGPRHFLQDADAIVLLNGDSLCRWPLRSLLKRHFKSKADATLMLLKKAPDDALGGGIGVDSAERVVQLRDYDSIGTVVRRQVFAGAHILSPSVFDRLQEGPGDIIANLYQPMLQDGANIQSASYRLPWHDLGTPQRYFDACFDHARAWKPSTLWRDNRIAPLASIAADAQLNKSIIETAARVDGGAQLQSSLVLEGAHIGAGSRIQNCIIGPQVAIAAGSDVEGRMINRFDKKHKLAEHESVMGSLIYTPLQS